MTTIPDEVVELATAMGIALHGDGPYEARLVAHFQALIDDHRPKESR